MGGGDTEAFLLFGGGEADEFFLPPFCGGGGDVEAFRLLFLGDIRPLRRKRGDFHGLAKDPAARFLTVPGESYSLRTAAVMSELVFRDLVDRF